MIYTQRYDDTGRFVGVLSSDGANIPNDPLNAQWRVFLDWNAAQPTPLSLANLPPSLAAAQAQKNAAIDAKTQSLLAAGFAYTPQGASSASNFPLTPEVNPDWIGMLLAASSLTYPFAIADVNGKIADLASAADVQAFFAAGVARAATIKQGGIALKSQVLAATTIDQVNAVTDSRT